VFNFEIDHLQFGRDQSEVESGLETTQTAVATRVALPGLAAH